jgi:hypothetical protein
MAWLSDLTAALGLPTGGLAAAAALYYGSTVAEKEASQQALTDIAKVLKNPSWLHDAQPNVFIENIFRFTFGDRQLSIKCIVRSITSSLIFFVIIYTFSTYFLSGKLFAAAITMLKFNPSLRDWILEMAQQLIMLTIVPDYISIAKARLIVYMIARSRITINIVFLVFVDVIMSLLISMISMTVYFILRYHNVTNDGIFLINNGILTFYMSFSALIGHIFGFENFFWMDSRWYSAYEFFILSTLLTSVWAIMALTSSVITKALLLIDYARRFIAWFFDVDKHPIRAIGMVAGGLVWAASLMVALIQVFFALDPLRTLVFKSFPVVCKIHNFCSAILSPKSRRF